MAAIRATAITLTLPPRPLQAGPRRYDEHEVTIACACALLNTSLLWNPNSGHAHAFAGAYLTERSAK